MTHSLPILASPAVTGFLSLWGGREVFASSVVLDAFVTSLILAAPGSRLLLNIL